MSNEEIHGGDEKLTIELTGGAQTRYGENPQQRGWFYKDVEGEPDPLGLDQFEKINGKEMSFNNYLDLNGALRTLCQIYVAIHQTTGKRPCVAVGVKHTNACGACFGISTAKKAEHLEDSVTRHMLAGDPVAIFGGIVILNFRVDLEIAKILLDTAREDPACNGKDRFLEVIAAPAFTPHALRLLREKGNLRLLVNKALEEPTIEQGQSKVSVRQGMLVQDLNVSVVTPKTWRLATSYALRKQQELTAVFVQAVCQTSQSNTITLARCDGAGLSYLVGNGVGQMSRVDCCRLAVEKAGKRARGAVAASDAFFPADDGPKVLIEAGVAGCISIEGSKADEQVIATFENDKVPLVLHDKRGFRHY